MKKVLSILLATIMCTGMATVSFAADKDKATGMTQSLAIGYSKSGGSDSYDLGTVRPNDKVKEYIYLYEDMFTWDDGREATHKLLTSSQIRKSKINVRNSVSSGSKAVDEVKLDNSKSRIEIKFQEEYVSTKELDFDFRIYLTVDGKQQRDYEMTLTGTFENEIEQVYEDQDYIDLSDGVVAEAQDFVKNIEVELGNGVTIFTKFFKDKKYYGTATRESDANDDVVFAKYADVDNVVTLKTIGLNTTGDIVRLDADDYSNYYYVYDKDMNYLGQSNELLPYSTKYYLANKKLDIVDDTDDTEEEAPATTDDGEGENPPSGGDDGIANSNANPSTGR